MKKETILRQIGRWYDEAHADRPFVPGKSRVHYAGRVFDHREITALVDSALDFWLTLGPQAAAFEKEFAARQGSKHCLVVTSGSSANLLAVAALCDPGLKHGLRPGDEVITPAVGFPTTVAPLVQNRLIPVFCDVDLATLNIDPAALKKAVSKKTRAVVLAHTLGNPAPLREIRALCDKHGLRLIEDNCDALDSRYGGKLTGSFGDIATYSFYAAHHITMGEGGAVTTSDPELNRIMLSLRDWGRACWCKTGEAHPAGACRKRFEWKHAGLPEGYDHKYVYDRIGYNLKPLDLQCAIGRVQLRKLDGFTKKRKENFRRMSEIFAPYAEHFILPRPQTGSDPSWFAYPMTVKKTAPFSRLEFVRYLEDRLIETRPVFAGNILRHPGYKDIPHRVAGTLKNSDIVLFNSFFLGVYPGMTPKHLSYIKRTVDSFFSR
jgi:CDP-6-deoxy-D-xylo-4-hexulose-3-dehydrase